MKRTTKLANLVCIGILFGTVAGCASSYRVKTKDQDPILKGRQLIRDGQPMEAVEYFEEMIKTNPQNIAAHRGLVEAAAFGGELDRVSELYRQWCRTPATQGVGHYGLGLIAAAEGGTNCAEALEHLRQAQELLPNEPDIPYRMGLVYSMDEEYANAEPLFRQSLELDANRVNVCVAYAHTLMQLGREKEAIEALGKILLLSPTAEEVQKARAICAKIFDPLRGIPAQIAQDLRLIVEDLERDQVQKALAQVESILSARGEVAFGYTLKGLAHSRLENNAEALTAFEQAIKLQPENPAALVGLGDVFMRLEKWQEARERYEKAIQLDPLDTEAYQRLGELARIREDPEQAVRAFRVLVLLDPEHLGYRHQLAIGLASTGKIEPAIEAYEGILEMKPDDLEALVRLGSLYLQQGDHELSQREQYKRRAKEVLEKAHELNPENKAVEEMVLKAEE